MLVSVFKQGVNNAIKSDITNSINSGKIVKIPVKEINYYDWKGSGYIIEDTETGSAGYMISGGLSGGSMALEEEVDSPIVSFVKGFIEGFGEGVQVGIMK